MLFLYNPAEQLQDSGGREAAAAQGTATATPAVPAAAACQTLQDLTGALRTQKATGFLQGEKVPQCEFHQQNWRPLCLADKERSWFRRFPFQVHTWSIILEGKIAIDVTLEQFCKRSLLSISFSRQRGMDNFYSSSFFMTHFHVIITIRSYFCRAFFSSD